MRGAWRAGEEDPAETEKERPSDLRSRKGELYAPVAGTLPLHHTYCVIMIGLNLISESVFQLKECKKGPKSLFIYAIFILE